MSDKPNIVFLLNDHQAYYRHGWDKEPRVQRPYFEGLASKGVNFTKSYTACPLCGPARRSILTGLYPHKHKEIKNDTNHPFDRPVYLDILARNGYRNYYYGKWHAGPGTAYKHHCEGFSYPSYNNPYTKPEYIEYLKKKGLPEPEIAIERMFWKHGNLREGSLYKQTLAWCNEHYTGILKTPSETHEAFFLANLARDKIQELAHSPRNQPFSLRVDFWGPHQPYFPTHEYADLYDPKDIPEYGNFRDNLENKPAIYLTEGNLGISEKRKIVRPNPLPWSEWQKVLARCYAHITMVDAAGGIILKTLEEEGLMDNTMVIWTSDHGDAVACHGGHFDKRSYMPEEMVRVPLAISFPSKVSPRQISSCLVSNIDVAPTILDAAGLGFPDEIDGRSLLPLCEGTDIEWREDLVCETHGHGENHLGRLLVAEQYKYVANRGQMDELYNLSEDPFELQNLINEKEYIDTLSNMKNRLKRWQTRSRDTVEVME